MYEELIKRLRSHANLVREYNESGKLFDEAADAIEELSKILDAVNDAHNEGYDVGYWSGRRDYEPKWIPVTERLPEPYTWVLVFAEKHEVAFDAFYDGSQWKDAILNGLVVTHWMPLPEPPPKEEN